MTTSTVTKWPWVIDNIDGGQRLVIIDKSVRDNTSVKFKPTSFHKMLFPAEVEDIPENTYNMHVILIKFTQALLI